MTKRNRRMNLLYLPALGLVLLFVLLPLVTSVKTSFYNWNGYSPVKKFVGMKNYLDLFKDENFKMAFLNTILYGFGSTILQNVLGLALALFLNTKFATATGMDTQIGKIASLMNRTTEKKTPLQVSLDQFSGHLALATFSVKNSIYFIQFLI